MDNKEVNHIQERKRKMVKRIMEIRAEINSLSSVDLMLIRSSQLEEYGKLLRQVVEFQNSIR